MPIAPGAIVNAPDILALGLTKIQMGTAIVVISAATNGSVSVTFPQPFASTPFLACTIVSASGTAAGATTLVTARSATGFTVRVDLRSSGTVSPGVDWVAVL
jgi:hypothetical protein